MVGVDGSLNDCRIREGLGSDRTVDKLGHVSILYVFWLVWSRSEYIRSSCFYCEETRALAMGFRLGLGCMRSEDPPGSSVRDRER